MTAQPPPPSWNRDTKILVTVIALLIIVALVYIARPIIPQLILAAILAYILQPLVDWLAQRGVKRGLAAALAVLLLVALVALVPIVLTPAIIRSTRAIADALGELPRVSQGWIDALIARNPTLKLPGQTIELAPVLVDAQADVLAAIENFKIPDVDQLANYAAQGLRTAEGLFRTAAGIASGVVSVFVAGLFLLFATFYLSRDGDQLGTWVDSMVLPQYRPELHELGRRLNAVWRSFFRGQIILSLTVGFLVFLYTALLGLPGAFILGILAGVLEVVPTIGPILAMIPAVILALVEGSSWLPVSHLVFALIVVLVYFGFQQVENNVLVPRIMGTSLNLHPLLVLIGVFVGFSFAGVLGAFLAAPVLASLKTIGLYAHAKTFGAPPFEDQVTPSVPRSRGLLARWRRGASPEAVSENAPRAQLTPSQPIPPGDTKTP